MACTYSIASPPPIIGGQAAIAVLELRGEKAAIDAALTALGGPRAVGEPHRVSLREFAGIDTVVVARTSETHAFIFPHAGVAIVRRLTGALELAGVRQVTQHDMPPTSDPPTGADLDLALHNALAMAASPLAIDVLLDQPRRWASECGAPRVERMPPESEAALSRLIHPPSVVALGRPNIGKSSLLNALAGRRVSIVADEPGSTRDHVGALIDCAGLVVRWIDTPGIDPTATDELSRLAQAAALEVARRADLVLLCSDPTTPAPAWSANPDTVLLVELRSDLAPPHPLGHSPDGPGATALIQVSVREPAGGRGTPDLVSAVRERLVPGAALADKRAWAFWRSLEGP